MNQLRDKIRNKSGLKLRPLKNAEPSNMSFKVLNCSKLTNLNSNSSNFNDLSTDNYKLKMSNSMCSECFDSDSSLIFYALLTLSCSYLRSNAIRSFKGFNWYNENNFIQLGSLLLNLATKYYGIVISELRKLLTSPNYNVSVAILTSNLLNKVSIYKYTKLLHSSTFSNGMVSILIDLLLKETKFPDHITFAVKFLIFASKSYYFPMYRPELLLEFHSILSKFQKLLNKDTDSTIVYHFSQLFGFTNELIQVTNSYIDKNPLILYNFLRKWLIILPSKVHVLEYSKNQKEKCLMYLFRTLARILDNLFPSAKFLFLQGFSGDIALWYEPNYIITLHDNNNDLINEIQSYCIRVSIFFQKRYNTLCIMFSNQRLKKTLPSNIIYEAIKKL